jgi:hypothetical protein
VILEHGIDTERKAAGHPQRGSGPQPAPADASLANPIFGGPRRAKYRGNNNARNALVRCAHPHHGIAGNPTLPNTAVAHLIRWSYEPVPRLTLSRQEDKQKLNKSVAAL